MSKDDQPAVGIPYPYDTNPKPPMQQMYSHPTQQQQFYYVGQNPYQAGMVPPNAIYGDPKGIPLQQTIFRDTPAPFNCVYCGSSGITDVNKDFKLDGPDSPIVEPCCLVESCNEGGLVHCDGLESKPSLAALIGCMMPMCLGVCFLCPSMDCLWHKYHYCPSCGQKVADFEKSDPCIMVDVPRWTEQSFAVPA